MASDRGDAGEAVLAHGVDAVSLTTPRPHLAPFAVLGLLLAGFNCLAFPVALVVGPGHALVATVSAGVVAAQVGLVATWGVFSSAPFLRRVGISALSGFLLFACFAFGVLVVNSVAPRELVSGIPMLLLMCPLFFSAVQLPLWAARTWLRWEVAKLDQAPRGSYAIPTRIKDFVWGTAAGSVVLALAKLAPHTLPAGEGDPPHELMIGFAIMSTVAAGASTVILPPLIFTMLGARRPATALVGVALWYATGLAVLLGANTLATGGLSAGSLTFCLLLTGTFTAVMCSGLLLVRGQGYRLRRDRLPQGVSP